MGVTDEMKLHFEEVLTGTYYEKYPELPRDKGVRFGYDIINESDRQYAKLLDIDCPVIPLISVPS